MGDYKSTGNKSKQRPTPKYRAEAEESGQSKKIQKKRRREIAVTDDVSIHGQDDLNPPSSLQNSTQHRIKKQKTNSSEAKTVIDLTEPQFSVLPVEDEIELPEEFSALRTTYDVTDMRIISSAKMEAKITRILETLAKFSFVKPGKPQIVYLHAKAPDASKLISILEISKRNIAEKQGKWYQYNQLGEIKEEKKRDEGGHVLGGSMAVDQGESLESTDFQFETMKTPIERALEGKPKVRSVPFLGVYLSRVRVESLKQQYGEQTNAQK